ncbi:MAG: TRAP transporter small permease subunit [Tistlia sp.]|uniref:TRAP transporter small permease n=1 Tax=Tistlia sp. TaxID=3057121 RepID=UPI0034A4D809
MLASATLWLRRLLDAAAALLLASVLAVTVARVVARYLLGVSMPWSEELTRLLFVWLVLIGASRTTHLRIDILPERLGRGGARRVLEVAVALLSVGLLGLLIWKAFGLIALTVYDRYTALDLSLQYLYWSLVIGGGLWIVTTLLAFLERSRPPDGPGPAGR